MSDIRTAFPVPTDPWEKAKNEFLVGLSKEQRDDFDQATVENVFYAASVAQKTHDSKSKSSRLHKTLRPLIEGIEDYGKALDAFANTSSLILCPLWGSVRIVLQMASQYGKYHDKVATMLSRIGDTLPRLRSYQALFPTHEGLLQALSNVYLDILRFSNETKNVFLKASKSHLPAIIACKSLWRPFQERYEQYLDDFRQYAKEVEKRTQLAHMIEQKRSYEIALRNQQFQEQQLRRIAHRQFLDRLCTLDYNAKHKRVLGDLAYKEPKISDMTTMSAGLVEHFRTTEPAGALITFHYCDSAQYNSLDTAVMLRSLLKQALQRLNSDDRTYESLTNGHDQEEDFDSEEQLVDMYHRVLPNFEKAIIVLDGLDELSPGNQNTTASAISRLIGGTHPPIKTIITSRREEPLIRRKLQHYTSLEIQTEHVQHDIKSFISDSVKYRISSGELVTSDPGLEFKITDTLQDKAHDMFLWVRFQLDEICEASSDSAIRRTLQDLPKDLAETFTRCLAKIQNSTGGNSKIHLAAKVFRWVACARRPLTIDELQEAVGLNESDKSFHPENTVSNGDRLVAVCGNLVVYDRDDRTVTLTHHTVLPFLGSWSNTHAELPKPPYSLNLHFDYASADAEIGDICVAYLHFADFETQVTRYQENTCELKQDLVQTLLWNSIPLGSLWARFSSLLSTKSGDDASKQLRLRLPLQASPSAPSDALRNKYAMLDYIINFWAFHTSSYTQESQNWIRFVNLVFDKQLAFGFRPWEAQSELSEKDQRWNEERLFRWAIKHDVVSLLYAIEPGWPLVDPSWVLILEPDILDMVYQGNTEQSKAKFIRIASRLFGMLSDDEARTVYAHLLAIAASADQSGLDLFQELWQDINMDRRVAELWMNELQSLALSYAIKKRDLPTLSQLVHCFEQISRPSGTMEVVKSIAVAVRDCAKISLIVLALIDRGEKGRAECLLEYVDDGFVMILRDHYSEKLRDGERDVAMMLLDWFRKQEPAWVRPARGWLTYVKQLLEHNDVDQNLLIARFLVQEANILLDRLSTYTWRLLLNIAVDKRYAWLMLYLIQPLAPNNVDGPEVDLTPLLTGNEELQQNLVQSVIILAEAETAFRSNLQENASYEAQWLRVHGLLEICII